MSFPAHVVVVLPRWVGDLVMSTPMLRTLANHFRDQRAAGTTRITGVMQPGFADLLDGTGWLDGVVPYSRRSKNAEVGFRAVAKRLREDPADAILLVPNSLSSAALAYAARGKRRIGVARHWRRWLLTDPIAPPRRGWRIEPSSTAEHAMQLVERLGVPRGSLRLELATTPRDESLADAFLQRCFPNWRAGHDGPLVVLNDNGAFGPAKSWGPERFGGLARLAVETIPGARVLVHCGPGDRAEARQIVAAAERPGVASLADEPTLPFGLSKAVLRRAAVVVTTDSGPRHVAAAFGRPTVVLLGPMDPRLSRSDHPSLIEMRRDLPCSPCGQRTCPLQHHDCMRQLSVEDVGQAMLQSLATPLVSQMASAARSGEQNLPDTSSTLPSQGSTS
jgi:heptosyltransferase-2